MTFSVTTNKPNLQHFIIEVDKEELCTYYVLSFHGETRLTFTKVMQHPGNDEIDDAFPAILLSITTDF